MVNTQWKAINNTVNMKIYNRNKREKTKPFCSTSTKQSHPCVGTYFTYPFMFVFLGCNAHTEARQWQRKCRNRRWSFMLLCICKFSRFYFYSCMPFFCFRLLNLHAFLCKLSSSSRHKTRVRVAKVISTILDYLHSSFVRQLPPKFDYYAALTNLQTFPCVFPFRGSKFQSDRGFVLPLHWSECKSILDVFCLARSKNSIIKKIT